MPSWSWLLIAFAAFVAAWAGLVLWLVAVGIAFVLRRFVKVGGEPLIRELWQARHGRSTLVLRLALLSTGSSRGGSG